MRVAKFAVLDPLNQPLAIEEFPVPEPESE